MGLFYKHIKNPIEYSYYSKNNRQFGYGPANLGNADNLGFEIDITKYIRHFGIKANYTYTYSAITTAKTLYQRVDGKITRTEVDQTRSLVGQAPHVANLALLYKNADNGWDAQIAAAFMSEKIAVASHYLNSDYYDNARFTLDVSAEKRLGSHFALYMKANNLLNTHNKQYIKTTNEANEGFEGQTMKGKTLIRDNENGTSVMLGFRYTL